MTPTGYNFQTEKKKIIKPDNNNQSIKSSISPTGTGIKGQLTSGTVGQTRCGSPIRASPAPLRSPATSRTDLRSTVAPHLTRPSRIIRYPLILRNILFMHQGRIDSAAILRTRKRPGGRWPEKKYDVDRERERERERERWEGGGRAQGISSCGD